ncbi:ATP-binding protein, partial [archaeon]|nr:ATP-binding protein [archaeon]
TRFSKNAGRLYENAVAIQLCRERAKDPTIEFYYWKDKSGKEVDFVVKQGLTVKQLIQVCCDISDFDTKKREIGAVLAAGKELRCNDLVVITEDYETKERYGRKTITYKPLWKWLLEKQS